ncbi:hypothetical protein ACWGLO_08790 [Streptomyces niveus]
MRIGAFSLRYATVLFAVLLAYKAFLSHTLVLPGDAADLAPDVLVTSTHYYSANYATAQEPHSRYSAPPKARALFHIEDFRVLRKAHCEGSVDPVVDPHDQGTERPYATAPAHAATEPRAPPPGPDRTLLSAWCDSPAHIRAHLQIWRV